jgi:myo-inositol-1(or 4)-monophosphatase
MGAASLDLAYVAAGRFEGYWERETHPWDVAAGLLIVTEAGGLAGPLREGGKPLQDGEVIAANAAVFERFAAVIRAA